MVSVIIPLYNGEHTIISALNSVKNQTYTDLEIIIVNDGSTDNGKEIVQGFMNDNSALNIRLINKTNGGVSSARNAGLKAAKGDLISLLDSDDEWEPHKLQEQIRVLAQHPEITFLTCKRNNDQITFPYKVKNGLAEITLKKLLFKVVGQTSTAIFRRTIVDRCLYYDEKQRYSEDANYWMKIALEYKMAILDKKLVTTGGGKANFGESGLSANLIEMEKGVQKNIDELYKLGGINSGEYIFFKLFSKTKYYKRRLIVKLR